MVASGQCIPRVLKAIEELSRISLSPTERQAFINLRVVIDLDGREERCEREERETQVGETDVKLVAMEQVCTDRLLC